MTNNVGFLKKPGATEPAKTPSALKRLNAESQARVERVKFLVVDVDEN